VLFVLVTVAATAFAHPGSGIAVAADGRVFFIDTGRGIFVIERDGSVTRLDAPAHHWFAFDAAKRFEGTRFPNIPGADIRSAGPLILSSDYPVVVGQDGAFYYPQFSDRLRLIRMTPDGASSVYATLPGSHHWVNGLAAAGDGALYYAEDNAVRKIDRRGVISTVADNISVAQCASIPGSDRPPYLRGLAIAPDGTIYVAASACGALLKIARGRVEPFLRISAPWSPTAVAVHDGEIYVLEYLHTASENRREWIPRVRKIGRDGKQVMLTK